MGFEGPPIGTAPPPLRSSGQATVEASDQVIRYFFAGKYQEATNGKLVTISLASPEMALMIFSQATQNITRERLLSGLRWTKSYRSLLM